MWLAHGKCSYVCMYYTEYMRRFGAIHVQYVCMRLVKVDESMHK